ncbi:hypothetical protein [Phaeospirillum tilakii]|uniref:Uncharacterized protein n=1 Tax=Phaeospirillum tilakii TaxID=741673 RepID=A0ABW5C7G2_9PROT
MLKSVTEHRLPAFLKVTAGFGALLENSRFALGPKGGADETVRRFDALESGAIPISRAHPFLAAPEALGSTPIVKLESWDQLPARHNRIESLSDAQLDEIQRDIVAWWWDDKEVLAQTVAGIIDASFARAGVL